MFIISTIMHIRSILSLNYVTEMHDTARDISEEIAETEWPVQSVLSLSVTRMGELSPCQGLCHQDYQEDSYPIPPPPPPPHLQDLIRDCHCLNQDQESQSQLSSTMNSIVFNKYFLVIICILCVVILLIICIYMIICAVNKRFVSFSIHELHLLFMFSEEENNPDCSWRTQRSSSHS